MFASLVRIRMASLNYKHLHYFGPSPNVAASLVPVNNCMTPQTISGQLSLSKISKVKLCFEKSGRNLELTEAGRLVFAYAEEIFLLGQELEQVPQHHPTERTVQLRVGVSLMRLQKQWPYKLLETCTTFASDLAYQLS